MIILNLVESNIQMNEFLEMKEILESYKHTYNFGVLVCPACDSTVVIRWGTYERNVIYWKDDIQMESQVLTVQRIRCKSCNRTHALLPIGIIPYKQFSSEVVTTVLKETNTNTIERISDLYYISENLIRKWISDFKEKHLSRLRTQLNDTVENMLEIIDRSIVEKVKYIMQYDRCFMQIKLGTIGLGPS